MQRERENEIGYVNVLIRLTRWRMIRGVPKWWGGDAEASDFVRRINLINEIMSNGQMERAESADRLAIFGFICVTLILTPRDHIWKDFYTLWVWLLMTINI